MREFYISYPKSWRKISIDFQQPPCDIRIKHKRSIEIRLTMELSRDDNQNTRSCLCIFRTAAKKNLVASRCFRFTKRCMLITTTLIISSEMKNIWLVRKNSVEESDAEQHVFCKVQLQISLKQWTFNVPHKHHIQIRRKTNVPNVYSMRVLFSQLPVIFLANNFLTMMLGRNTYVTW